MGQSIDGKLVYGFDLGGADSVWHLKGVEKYEAWLPSWATPEQLAELGGPGDEFSYGSAMTRQLAAHDLEGLHVAAYGDLTVPDKMGYALVAYQASASGTRTLALHLGDLVERRDIERWDEALGKALEVLDIRPWQPTPDFLLTQCYG